MTTRFCLVVALVLGGASICSAADSEPESHILSEGESSLTEEELDSLLGPMALHPDPLVALMLPASTVPTDIVLAARFLRSGGKVNEGSTLDWDESVISLAQYPELVYWLDEELSGTVHVGKAFLADPAGVMNAIQRLRGKAHAAGTLSNTPQQRVVVEDEVISIVPTSSRVIYVPTYDPVIVYTPRPVHRRSVYLRFGYARPIGGWLRYDCDWWRSRIWCYDAPYRHRSDWERRRHHYREVHDRVPGARPWVPRHRDREWGRPPHREVVHVERPRFDAEPPTRDAIAEKQVRDGGVVPLPRLRPGAEPPRRDAGPPVRTPARRVVERREPIEREPQPRAPVVRERASQPRLAAPPVRTPAASVTPAAPKPAPRVITAAPHTPRIQPQPRASAPQRVIPAPAPRSQATPAPRQAAPPPRPVVATPAPAPRIAPPPAAPAPKESAAHERSPRERSER